MTTPITQHEGRKYLRQIFEASAEEGKPPRSVWIDVYAVIDSFDIKCPAVAHAVKKLLCAGQRKKGTYIEDLQGVIASANRAIELDRARMHREELDPKKNEEKP